MFNVLTLTDYIRDELAKRIETTTFRWKRTDSLDKDEYNEVKPTVLAYTYDDLNADGYPTEMPSILIQPVSEEGGEWHYVVFVCTVHPAIQEIEKTDETQSESGVYKHRDSADYDSFGAKKELYKTALLLTEQVALALKRIGNTNAALSNIVTNAPSPLLPDIPYCSGTVEFDARIPQTASTIDTRIRELL